MEIMRSLESGMFLSVECAGINIPFEGRIGSVEDSVLTFVGENDRKLPTVFSGTEVKLKIVVPGKGLVVYHGTVLRSSKQEWVIGNLGDWDGWERRGFYRQKVDLAVSVRSLMEAKSADIQGKVLDISALGLKLSITGHDFARNDLLLVRDVQLLPDMESLSFRCKVLRVEKNVKSTFYGCCFDDMSEVEQDRLVRIIFHLQQLERRNQKL